MWPSAIVNSDQRWQLVAADGSWRQPAMAVNSRQWGTAVAAMDGGGWRQRTVDKVNRKRISWHKVKRIIMRRYKI